MLCLKENCFNSNWLIKKTLQLFNLLPPLLVFSLLPPHLVLALFPRPLNYDLLHPLVSNFLILPHALVSNLLLHVLPWLPPLYLLFNISSYFVFLSSSLKSIEKGNSEGGRTIFLLMDFKNEIFPSNLFVHFFKTQRERNIS